MITDRWWASVITLSVAILIGAMIMGCATDKGPAEAALAAAETAVNSAVAEASKYVPDQARSLQAGLTAVKEKFSKGDYAAVISEAKALAGKAKDLASAASARKIELTQTWETLNAGVPKVVEAIKGRVDVLSQSKKLPANMTADKLATAKSGLGEITQQWTAAIEAYKGGDLMDAITKGTAVKTKAAEVLAVLGMPVPEALKG
jgi:hypothetical protein